MFNLELQTNAYHGDNVRHAHREETALFMNTADECIYVVGSIVNRAVHLL